QTNSDHCTATPAGAPRQRAPGARDSPGGPVARRLPSEPEQPGHGPGGEWQRPAWRAAHPQERETTHQGGTPGGRPSRPGTEARPLAIRPEPQLLRSVRQLAPQHVRLRSDHEPGHDHGPRWPDVPAVAPRVYTPL